MPSWTRAEAVALPWVDCPPQAPTQGQPPLWPVSTRSIYRLALELGHVLYWLPNLFPTQTS